MPIPCWLADQLDVCGTVATVVVGPAEGGVDGNVGVGPRVTESAAVAVETGRTTVIVTGKGGGTVAGVENPGRPMR